MKAVLAKAALVVATLAAVNPSAFATPCAQDPKVPYPSCLPTGEVPEPSSPLLFLAAAGVAGLVLKIRKKK